MEEYCSFRCKHAKFTKDTWCSDNITFYCKKLKRMVRKWEPCKVGRSSIKNEKEPTNPLPTPNHSEKV